MIDSCFFLLKHPSFVGGFYFFINILSSNTSPSNKIERNQVARIPSRLYFSIFEKGGDSLLGIYASLLAFKSGDIKYKAYKAKNNKKVSNYSLLRTKTNISLATLKKYIPVLVEMGLCHFHENGDFVMMGSNKLKKIYGSNKLVPIVIGENLTHTKYNCISVRLHSAERQQQRRIERKKHLRELLKQAVNPTNIRDYKRGLKVAKKYSKKDLKGIDKTVLSNMGFAKLKDGSKNNKSKGIYWKRVLVKNNLVLCEREQTKISKMSFHKYQGIKLYSGMPIKYTYWDGYMVKERISSFRAKSLL